MKSVLTFSAGLMLGAAYVATAQTMGTAEPQRLLATASVSVEARPIVTVIKTDHDGYVICSPETKP